MTPQISGSTLQNHISVTTTQLTLSFWVHAINHKELLEATEILDGTIPWATMWTVLLLS